MDTPRLLIALGTAGAFGAISRYLLTQYVERLSANFSFPVGTLVVNILGCFILGALMQWSVHSSSLSREWQLILGVGFLGALTTYSTFSYQVVRLVQEGQLAGATLHLSLHLVVGFLATFFGMISARSLS